MGFEQKPILVGRIFRPGCSHGCCLVHATGTHYRADVIACGRYLLAPLTGNKEGSKSLMVLGVKSTPSRFPTNSLHTPMDNTTVLLHQVCATHGEGVCSCSTKPTKRYELTQWSLQNSAWVFFRRTFLSVNFYITRVPFSPTGCKVSALNCHRVCPE